MSEFRLLLFLFLEKKAHANSRCLDCIINSSVNLLLYVNTKYLLFINLY
jgi:hypothetical protein